MPPTSPIPKVQFDQTLPHMDREQIDSLLMLDEGEDSSALVKSLFKIFREESEEKIQGLSAACSNGDIEGLRRIVHFITGSAGNLGMARLAGFYRALERALAEGQLSDISDLEAPIREEFDKGCAAFVRELALELD